MKLLALETATEACSVALQVDGQVRERFEIAPRRHAELLLPWAEQLLAEAGIVRGQLDAIALGRGPGAFTGVRLAIAIAQGIALALDRPLLPVSTLQVLAMQASGEATHALASIDARMGEVYAARCVRDTEGVMQVQGAEVVIAPDALQLPDDGSRWAGIGTGFSAAEGLLATRLQARLSSVDAQALPRASDVLKIAVPAFARGGGIAPERVQPAYLRDNVALTLVEQQALRASR
ncbi:tRNA (adenosine(37)-N6)-threonylcarbamoyltransferase complex dimerization subunit type 1 TsaB [Stenotrophomonas mori]|uniref:tRNA threonylcarbamoyladenosine biosynthesis protein TsaB n=1 Tax=Stenotrophomonas mori TaxID=2871096 RepID=A0ABT0SDJ5_9GAMM|nr:tRNA (adenosine(37)-N6)-threonylcarbamoyltransferase complex dimerization subunit type 1 TsaB [Stenotrophomonas mori]MCL7713381.1 tRNA (adenosine(37)-N6)-threonylcarbamoyltransferase complex dimerization subunit type 1 TsaB [Stenotrophomonas mori]